MKNYAASFAAATLAAILVSYAGAQTPPPPAPPAPVQPCPAMNMTAPTAAVLEGQLVTFSIALSAGEAGVRPFYEWSVSGGSITSGQSTPAIRVDTTSAASYGSITATVFVTGYLPSCPNSASASVEVKVRPVSRKIDEYSELKPADEEERLDAGVAELQSDPGSKLYLIVYRSAKTKPGAIEPLLQRAYNHLTKRSIPMDRIERIYGERREPPFMEIWFVPPNAGAPQPTSTAAPKPKPPVKKP